MQANCWRWPKAATRPICIAFSPIASVVIGLAFHAPALGQSVVSNSPNVPNSSTSALHGGGFFEGRDLDFWREGKKVPPYLPSGQPLKGATALAEGLLPPSGSVIRQRDALPFDWTKYQDPKHPEFWDDGGDYVAPRPLRESVANPTPENLDAYLAWQAKRLEVVATFDAKLAQHALGLVVPETAPAAVRSSAVHSSAVRWDEIDLLYFYQSSCPHCVAEKEHVESLARRGVRVAFIQMDADQRPPLHLRSVPYTAAHSRQFAITATPTWIFRRRKASVRLQGEQSEGELLSHISTLFSDSRHPNNERNK